MFYISPEEMQQIELEAAFDQWQYENFVDEFDEANRDEDARFVSALAITVDQSWL